jgi:5-methylcytosine-specific restriction endonuclease McrA
VRSGGSAQTGLELEAYPYLSRAVLARYEWRCQDYGVTPALQVHHIRSRSRLGDDTEENLIVLCVDCHRARHLRRQTA